MVFSGAVFLYAFLPLTLAVYALAPQRGRNAVLLIASLLFYAFGEPVYVLLLLLSSVSNWALSLCIERRRGTRRAKSAFSRYSRNAVPKPSSPIWNAKPARARRC